MPIDVNAKPIQILSAAENGTAHLTSTEAGSARVALPAGAEVVRIASSGAVWLAFGDNTVTAAAAAANSMLFPAGAEFFFLLPSSYTNVAARSVTGAGNVLISITRMI